MANNHTNTQDTVKLMPRNLNPRQTLSAAGIRRHPPPPHPTPATCYRQLEAGPCSSLRIHLHFREEGEALNGSPWGDLTTHFPPHERMQQRTPQVVRDFGGPCAWVCMSACIHIHVTLYVSMYTCVIVCVRVCCVFVSMFVCACLYAHVSMHVCVARICVNMCVCRGVVMGSERGLPSDMRLLFTPTPACGILLDAQ